MADPPLVSAIDAGSLCFLLDADLRVSGLSLPNLNGDEMAPLRDADMLAPDVALANAAGADDSPSQ